MATGVPPGLYLLVDAPPPYQDAEEDQDDDDYDTGHSSWGQLEFMGHLCDRHRRDAHQIVAFIGA